MLCVTLYPGYQRVLVFVFRVRIQSGELQTFTLKVHDTVDRYSPYPQYEDTILVNVVAAFENALKNLTKQAQKELEKMADTLGVPASLLRD